MQENEQENTRRQDAMMFLYQSVGNLVAELCDVKQEDILSKSKVQPLPICRGMCWYAVRVAFDATYKELSKLMQWVASTRAQESVLALVKQLAFQSVLHIGQKFGIKLSLYCRMMLPRTTKTSSFKSLYRKAQRIT